MGVMKLNGRMKMIYSIIWITRNRRRTPASCVANVDSNEKQI